MSAINPEERIFSGRRSGRRLGSRAVRCCKCCLDQAYSSVLSCLLALGLDASRRHSFDRAATTSLALLSLAGGSPGPNHAAAASRAQRCRSRGLPENRRSASEMHDTIGA